AQGLRPAGAAARSPSSASHSSARAAPPSRSTAVPSTCLRSPLDPLFYPKAVSKEIGCYITVSIHRAQNVAPVGEGALRYQRTKSTAPPSDHGPYLCRGQRRSACATLRIWAK